MDTHHFDIVVIGAGIAGATAAAHLAPDHRVALVEAEDAAGYHTTGRSAALWTQNYGPTDVRALTRLSRAFFDTPPGGFTDVPLMAQRTVAIIGTGDEVAEALADGEGLRAASRDELRAIVPALRPDFDGAVALEDDAFDMDVAALHQGFLRELGRRGGVLALRSRAGAIARRAGMWHVTVTNGDVFTAPVVVDAAGAWGDEVAAHAGKTPLGLVPKRRTACIVDPAPWPPATWPMITEIGDAEWYARPEARTKLLVSPADETPTHAHDVQPEEIDVATGIARMQSVLAIDVHRVERAWAGLRTFTPDGSLAIGFDAASDGFFWCVGQGGYGIQTSPAAGRLVADLVSGRDPGAAASVLTLIDPRRFA